MYTRKSLLWIIVAVALGGGTPIDGSMRMLGRQGYHFGHRG